jgi:WD40 repeat protein
MAEEAVSSEVQKVEEPPAVVAESEAVEEPVSPTKLRQLERTILEDDYFYPENHLKKVLPESSITSKLSNFHWCSGIDSSKRNNVCILSDEEIMFATGSTYHIFNINTKERKIYFANDENGVGTIAVHPQKTFFAIGEKGKFPNVYIYDYPKFRLYRILAKGAERGFSAIAWSNSGEKLATVASSPDYTITIWDWLQ